KTLDIKECIFFDDFDPTGQLRTFQIHPGSRTLLHIRANALIDFHRCVWKSLVGPARIDPEGTEVTTLDQAPGALFQLFHSLWRSPGFRKIGDSEHPPQPLLDLCDVRIGLQWQQDPARNPPRLTRTAIRHNAVDVGAQPILEVIAVAFLQTQFVVMDDDETVHSGIIVEVIRLDWCYISLMAAPYRACIRSAHVLMAAPSLEAARYRACASRRACIRSAHVLMAAPSLEAA